MPQSISAGNQELLAYIMMRASCRGIPSKALRVSSQCSNFVILQKGCTSLQIAFPVNDDGQIDIRGSCQLTTFFGTPFQPPSMEMVDVDGLSLRIEAFLVS